MTRKPNALINETSPYLLQHAYNPVNWMPWNEESLAKAKNENKMLLVSIGYAACHWCHVMEHESFEDEEVAALMNQYFICIKIDREEQPDVDQFFMEAVQLLSGRGGWPLNCFALPDGRPVWGGTYFRKEQWISILNQISQLFETQKDDLEEQAQQLTQGIQQNQINDRIISTEIISDEISKAAATTLLKHLDFEKGGTKGAPKFPMPDLLMLELEMAAMSGDKNLNDHAMQTLEKMARGGIYDQIGGGFARYSVDARWHVPHFEKMLYDNAQLIGLYTEAWRKTKNPLFKEVVEQSIAFCLRELHGSEGGFLAAIDADSEKEEGKFYVWTKAEFETILGRDAALLMAYFQIDQQAFWEEGKNVLVRPERDEDFASRNGLSLEVWMQKLNQSRNKLFAYREQRIRPATDDKRLLSWNALMIKSLARAAVIFDRKEWLKAAIQAYDFIQQHMRSSDGSYYRSWKEGKLKIKAFLDDYAFLIQAALQLHYATNEVKYAIAAEKVLKQVLDAFYVDSEQSFAYTAKSERKLAVTIFENYDNVIPSSNAAIAHGLISLGLIFEKHDYLKLADRLIKGQIDRMKKFPTSFSNWLQALILYEKQATIVVKGADSDIVAIELQKNMSPGIIVLGTTEKGLPLVDEKPQHDTTRFYFCDTLGCRPAYETMNEAINALKTSET